MTRTARHPVADPGLLLKKHQRGRVGWLFGLRFVRRLLAAVLPSPRRLHADHPSLYLQSRVRWIMAHMEKLGGTRCLDWM